MHGRFYGDGRWLSVARQISSVVDLEATAREYKALQRARKIKTAEALLRLALIYGPGGHSLRSAAALAGDAGIAELSDKAVEGRLRKMGDWLAHILLELLAAQRGAPLRPDAGDLELVLVDGSVICAPGKGATWRLHARYDPGRGRFADLVLTDAKAAERLDRTEIGPGKTIIADRGYARVRDFQAVLAEGSDFLTRIGWRSLRLLDANGQPLDLLAMLPQGDAAREQAVWLKGIARPLRLVLHRLPADAAERQRRKRARKAGKAGHQLDPRTTTAAGYLMLLTSLPPTTSPDQAVSLYRNRWQIEIGFKRLKTLGHIDALPAADPNLARTWLLAHLIAAVLADDLAQQIVGFPP
jgi:hypothetical protein